MKTNRPAQYQHITMTRRRWQLTVHPGHPHTAVLPLLVSCLHPCRKRIMDGSWGRRCIWAAMALWCYNTRTSTLWIPDTSDRHAYIYSLTHRSMVDSYRLTNSLTLCPIVVIALYPCYYMRSTLCPVTILAMPFALAHYVYKLMYL